MARGSGRIAGLAGVAVALLLLVGCDDGGPATRGEASTVVDAHVRELPDGWRWEAFEGVEVGVPGSWGWGSGAQRLDQWCVEEREHPRLPPIVGRPGFSSLVSCFSRPRGADPATLVAHTGRVVAFSSPAAGPRPGIRGDQEVRRIGEVLVTVNAPTRLRERILATARRVDVDSRGCPMFLPAGFRAGDRPAEGRDVATISEVTAVSACRYTLPSPDERRASPVALFASLRLEGAPAADVVEAIAAAPVGGGPDFPRGCLADWSYGDEMVVARIESAEGVSTVHVRYAGCDHHGFDDGTRVRSLTAAAVQPLLTDATAPGLWDERLSGILAADRPAVSGLPR